MTQTSEIILSGSGGQGLILAGQILAEAVIRDGKRRADQSYGRKPGRSQQAEVIISNDDIDYPKVTKPDIVLAMSQEALSRYAGELDPNGTLIIDSTYVKALAQTDARMISAPFSRLAKESLGKEMVANVVALGPWCCNRRSFHGIVESGLIVPHSPGTEVLNKKLLNWAGKAPVSRCLEFPSPAKDY